MKKTSIAFLVLTCSTPVFAFDMSEWTRNSSSATAKAQPQQPNQEPTQKQQPTNTDLKTPSHTTLQLDQSKQGAPVNLNGSVQPKQNVGSNYQPQQYPQKQVEYNGNNQYQVQQNNSANGKLNNSNANNAANGVAFEIDPLTASKMDQESARIVGMLNQIMRINVNGYSVVGKQKQALESFNGSLQMLAGIWASGSQSERAKLDFELYNYSVGCATKQGITNQARSLLSAYDQLNGMGGFAQYVQSKGKVLGTTGPTLGC